LTDPTNADRGFYEARIGTTFTTSVGDGSAVELVLEAVEGLGPGSFVVRFTGPPRPVLGQGIRDLVGPTHSIGLFLAPVAAAGGGVTYEAVFGDEDSDDTDDETDDEADDE